MILHSSEGPDEGYDQEKPQPVNAPVPFEKTAVDNVPTKGDVLRHMADRFHGMPDVAADLRLFAHEIDRLQRWQREALLVMADWDDAYQRSGVQAFGVTKAAALLNEIERLRADLAAAYCRMDDMEGLNDV